MTMLRTTHSLIAVLTLVLLVSGFRAELRVALNGVDAPSLALAIPVLGLAALVTALTSAATALVLEMAALILLGLYLIEEGGDALVLSAVVGLLVMGGLCFAQIRLSSPKDD